METENTENENTQKFEDSTPETVQDGKKMGNDELFQELSENFEDYTLGKRPLPSGATSQLGKFVILLMAQIHHLRKQVDTLLVEKEHREDVIPSSGPPISEAEGGSPFGSPFQSKSGFSNTPIYSSEGRTRGSPGNESTDPRQQVERIPASVFVAPIFAETSQREIFNLFRDCGRIKKVKLGHPAGNYAFVAFHDMDGVRKALRLDGIRFKGRIISVEMPKKYKKYMIDAIFVANFPENVTTLQLEQFFDKKIEENCVRNVYFKDKFAFVYFKDWRHAFTALSEMDGQNIVEGHALDMYPVVEQEKITHHNCILVTGYPRTWTNFDLKGLFNKYGMICGIRTSPGNTAEVKFVDVSASKKCYLTAKNDGICVEGKFLEIKRTINPRGGWHERYETASIPPSGRNNDRRQQSRGGPVSISSFFRGDNYGQNNRHHDRRNQGGSFGYHRNNYQRGGGGFNRWGGGNSQPGFGRGGFGRGSSFSNNSGFGNNNTTPDKKNFSREPHGLSYGFGYHGGSSNLRTSNNPHTTTNTTVSPNTAKNGNIPNQNISSSSAGGKAPFSSISSFSSGTNSGPFGRNSSGFMKWNTFGNQNTGTGEGNNQGAPVLSTRSSPADASWSNYLREKEKEREESSKSSPSVEKSDETENSTQEIVSVE